MRLRGRHCCLGFAASAQLPITRSPASQLARSNRLAGYSPERLGHVSSIDFCNCMNSQARPRMPKPRRVYAVASHRTVGDVVLARRHLLSLHSPGVARPTEETCDDRCVVRYAATAFPQPVLPQTPPVTHQRRRCLEQATVGDHTDPDARRRRAWPLPNPLDVSTQDALNGRTSSPGAQRRSVACLEGPPPAGARESADSQPHPGCLPPLGPTTPFESRW